MEPKSPIIAVDSDVFVRDLRYLRDREYGINKQFLEILRAAKNGFTTLYNLLEICGILSFNLNPGQLIQEKEVRLDSYLQNAEEDKYNIC
jgi:DNA-binding Xre family transcriptional regulator